jgi:acyl-CoA dehydrogenase
VINLETPRRLAPLAAQANEVARAVLRPISRKYDRAEHAYPKELDMLAALMEGMGASGEMSGAGAAGVRRDGERAQEGNRNGSNMATVLGIIELC